MTINIQYLFNEALPAAIAKNPEAAKAIGGTYQLSISGESGGEWYVDCSDSEPKAEAGNPGGADCSIAIAADDFQKLIEDPQGQGMQLFFGGKLKVSGNQMLAMKLQKLFELLDT